MHVCVIVKCLAFGGRFDPASLLEVRYDDKLIQVGEPFYTITSDGGYRHGLRLLVQHELTYWPAEHTSAYN